MRQSLLIPKAIPWFAIRRTCDYVLKPGAIMVAIHLLTFLFEAIIVGPEHMLPFGQRFLLSNLVAAPFVGVAFVLFTYLDRLQLKLATLAMTDFLTELPNRRAFLERSTEAASGYLLVIDADHFKLINDTYGHAAGDACLQAIADQLRNITRDTDIIGRIGGEEFASFLPNATERQVSALAKRLTRPIIVPIEDHPIPVKLTLSLGASLRRKDETNENAFKRADSALYVAKNTGRGRLVFWTPAMQECAA
ncbi:GGDEF domain-containing protein [Yoonia sp.]|uniref:GGDEF domain-containing protein n=1 Tax=Yoonia sp. TaxID=2212373 RepID=UPI0025E630A6|nr:GGDEF domain-containing protein [Yoonia sp.]